MFTLVWKYDDEKKNGNNYNEYDMAYAGGPSIITNIRKNRLHEKKNLNFSGHTANAYGLFGGVFFDRVKGYGVIYRGNGVSKNLDEYISNYSAYNQWALDFIKLADDIAQFDYPEIDDGSKKDNSGENKDNNTYIYIIIIIAVILLICIIIFLVWRCCKRNNATKEEESPRNESLMEY